MSNRLAGQNVLFVPGWFFSARVCEQMPGPSRALTDLRAAHGAVDVFEWPCIKAGPDVAPTWEAAADALAETFSHGLHVVVAGGDSPIVLAALARSEARLGSLAVAGIRPPPATLRALGFDDLADATSALYRVDHAYQFLRLLMDGAAEDTIAHWAETMDGDIDWPYAVQFRASYEQLNLLREEVRVDMPVLYLDPAARVVGYTEMREVFLRWAPEAAMQDLDLWPGKLHEPESGRDFSSRVTAFINAL